MALRAKRYFEDYDVESVERGGRLVRRYVYKGDLYARELSERARAAERAAYPLLALLAGGLLLAAMRQPVAPNVSGVFAALSLLAMIPAFCVLEGAVEAFFRKGDLQAESYRERLIMLRVMPVIGAGLGLLLAVGYGFDGLVRGAATAANLLAMVCALGMAALYAGLAAREIRVRYRVIKGERSTGKTSAAQDAPDMPDAETSDE